MVASLNITLLYAGLLAVLLIIWSLNVVRLRLQEQVGLGSGQSMRLAAAIRIQGNFVEYVPMALVLLALMEWHGAAAPLLHTLGLVLLIGRLIHGIGLTQSAGKSAGRMLGTLATMAVLLVQAGYALGAYFGVVL